MPTVLETSHSATESRIVEMEFVVDALPVELIGMNSAMMCNYIKFCADRLLIAFGCRCHYKFGNPFEWMETISFTGKDKLLQKSCWRILEIGRWSGLRGPNFCSWRQFLMGTNTHTYKMHTTSIKKHLAIPPALTCVCFRGFTETNTKHVNMHKRLQ